MTRRKAFGLWWYNNVKRHWHNWRLKRMWEAEGRPTKLLPRAGAIRPDTWQWATDEIRKLGLDK